MRVTSECETNAELHSRGLFALKMRPTSGVPNVRFGRSKFTRLKRLKTSHRNSSEEPRTIQVRPMLNRPAVEICGKPTSRGSRVTPVRPAWPAKSTPRFKRSCPVDVQIAEAQLVHPRGPEESRVAEGGVPRGRRERSPESRDQRFLQRAGAERLHFFGIECAEPGEQLVVVRNATVEPQTERGAVLRLARNGRQILKRGAGRRPCDVLKKCGRERIDPIGWYLVVGKRRAGAGRGVDRHGSCGRSAAVERPRDSR